MSGRGKAVHNSHARRHPLCVIRPMPRKLLKRYLPDPTHLREHRHLRLFGERLTDPNLWHLNRRCVANGALIGLFWALVPMPLQMVPAAMCAILFRANIPITVALVWLTNPLTIVPVFYATYLLGTFLLGIQPTWELNDDSLEAASATILANIGQVYVPMLFGSLLVGTLLGCSAWVAVHYVWRAHVRHQWRVREEKRRSQPPGDS